MKASTGTMYVKPWGKGQGNKVLIEKSDYDPKIHTKLGAKKKPAAKSKAEK